MFAWYGVPLSEKSICSKSIFFNHIHSKHNPYTNMVVLDDNSLVKKNLLGEVPSPTQLQEYGVDKLIPLVPERCSSCVTMLSRKLHIKFRAAKQILTTLSMVFYFFFLDNQFLSVFLLRTLSRTRLNYLRIRMFLWPK